MIFSFCAISFAQTITYDGITEEYPWAPIVMVVDGNTVETGEMPPIILNGRTLVPAREFFEQLGAKVGWEQETKTVTVSCDGEDIVMKIDSRSVYKGNKVLEISQSDPPPKIINNKTMIPVRFVAEELGFSVSWENETRTVNISSPNKGSVTLKGIELLNENGKDVIFARVSDFVNPNVFKMQSPDRIVIDIYGVKSAIKDGSVNKSGISVEDVRYSAHDDRFRIVADMSAGADFAVEKRENGIAVILTPTGEPSTEKPSENNSDVSGRTVVIDAGHGGSDPGAIFPHNSLKPNIREKDVALAVALKVRDALEAAGVNVVMTRDSDTFPSLKERVEIANASGADLFVSIHCNSMETRFDVDGAQVYYHTSSEFGKKFATIVYDKIIDYTGMTKRNIQDGSTLYVIRHTSMPAILTEGGFVSNEKDRRYLLSEEGRQALANAIADGVIEALELL